MSYDLSKFQVRKTRDHRTDPSTYRYEILYNGRKATEAEYKWWRQQDCEKQGKWYATVPGLTRGGYPAGFCVPKQGKYKITISGIEYVFSYGKLVAKRQVSESTEGTRAPLRVATEQAKAAAEARAKMMPIYWGAAAAIVVGVLIWQKRQGS